MGQREQALEKLRVMYTRVIEYDARKRAYTHERAARRLSQTKTNGLLEVDEMLTLAACELAEANRQCNASNDFVDEMLIAIDNSPVKDAGLDELTGMIEIYEEQVEFPKNNMDQVRGRVCVAAHQFMIYIRVKESTETN